MNILFLADIVPYPPNTGIKIRTYNILKQLYHGGENRIFLLCFNHRTLIPTDELLSECTIRLRELASEVHVFDIPSDRNRLAWLSCLGRNLFQNIPYRSARYSSAECLNTVNALLHRVTIDLVHLDKTEFFNYRPAFGRIPVVCTNHNVESNLMLQRSRYEINAMRRVFAYTQYRKTRNFEKKALSETDGYITCTDVDARFFQAQIGEEKICAVIENGVDTNRYPFWEGAVADYILIIGGQNKESTANFDATHYFFREIWPLVVRRHPRLRVKIVGRNPDPSVTSYQSTLKNVEVLGFLEDEREALGKALALVVPLRIGGGSRLKILTAMSMGKAVVSTSVGAEGISCEHNRNILLADLPEKYAACISMVIENTELRRKIGVGARELVERCYDWNSIGAKLRAFYGSVVKSYA